MVHANGLPTIWGNVPYPVPGAASGPEPVADTSPPVSPDDPAVEFIRQAAARVAEFGYDPTDPDVTARIVEAGRREHGEAVAAARKRRQGGAVRPPAPGEVVYYMRIGNRVKIGWSANLAGRLAALNPEELMATEPGGFDLEQQRHIEFCQLWTHGEWFRLAAPLVGHIENLQRGVVTPIVLADIDVEPPTAIPTGKLRSLITTADASSLAGVKVAAIRKWVQRGHLAVAARDDRGRPLFRWIDVAKAEHATRAHARRTFAA